MEEGEEETSSLKITRNVEQIEALLRRINEEKKKTKEVLDSIKSTCDAQEETTTKIVLSKNSIISLKKKKAIK